MKPPPCGGGGFTQIKVWVTKSHIKGGNAITVSQRFGFHLVFTIPDSRYINFLNGYKAYDQLVGF